MFQCCPRYKKKEKHNKPPDLWYVVISNESYNFTNDRSRMTFRNAHLTGIVRKVCCFYDNYAVDIKSWVMYACRY